MKLMSGQVREASFAWYMFKQQQRHNPAIGNLISLSGLT